MTRFSDWFARQAIELVLQELAEIHSDRLGYD